MQRGTLCFECKAKALWNRTESNGFFWVFLQTEVAKAWWTRTESKGNFLEKNPKGRQKKVRNSTVLDGNDFWCQNQ